MLSRSSTCALLTCTLAFLPACAGDPERLEAPLDAPTPTPQPGPEPPAPLQLTWSPCDLFSGGAGDGTATCTELEVPLTWDDPAGRTLTLFVKRLQATAPRRGALLLLDGGPGGGSVGPEGVAHDLAQRDPGLDVYLPHHRGTGLSTRLSCAGDAPGSESGVLITDAEWPACIDELQQQWGAGLSAFNTTEAARDLGALVAAIQAEHPEEQTFVLGSSYGTYLANRYLTLHPDQPTAVIYDSICPPDACHLDEFDVLYDQVATEFLALCGADATCSSHLGPDPRARLATLYDALDAGHCPALGDRGVDRSLLRKVLGILLNDWNLRLAIPAVIRRVERCSNDDLTALDHLLDLLSSDPQTPSPFLTAWSFPLQNNILFSELWSAPPPPVADILAAAEATLISQGTTLQEADLFTVWPRYERDAHFGQWASTTVPLLMMNGDLDPATPITLAERVADHHTAPGQTFVRLPRSPHGVLTGSPIHPNGETCGTALLLAFLADPHAPLDTSCKDQVLPLNFAGAPWLAQALFGTSDFYGLP
ncbi:alpha/beta fold hydrolase [Chondromyces crocatus]|uniref:AB hydrolase-1 domain-containing protein n=1 Tax=Chondromyces crocatus TaxID=52 RepID=A0A0K1ESD2_CHOCO|nr:alpha/beta fold hydrolase [Chondromyces crocatus]AKT43699.1 uncharacterized protein CMC5_079340 [Chondromyces crocatus]